MFSQGLKILSKSQMFSHVHKSSFEFSNVLSTSQKFSRILKSYFKFSNVLSSSLKLSKVLSGSEKLSQVLSISSQKFLKHQGKCQLIKKKIVCVHCNNDKFSLTSCDLLAYPVLLFLFWE